MTWDNYNLPLIRRGEVETFETKTYYPSDRTVWELPPYKKFSALLKDVKIIKRPENFTISGDLLNAVVGPGEPNIEKGNTIGILSEVSPLGASFKDKIVRKLRFNKNEKSFYEILGTFYL